MADEAFALSPIAARSASPTDADYDAIREAFMETARGRWFLGEYAKRNRNADTAMVLEAVMRLEQSVAASRNEATASAPAADSADVTSSAPAQDEILASVKIILERTRAALVAALSPFQRSARIIQEIAWGLRESGSDGRICTILDEQVRAMALACESFAAAEQRDAILHTFDASLVQIEKLAEGETAPARDEPAIAPGEVSRDSEDRAPSLGEVQTAAAASNPVPDMDASVIEVAASSTPNAIQAPAEPSLTADTVAQKKPTARSSLGHSLLAHGIVSPKATTTDPLAPIRRMSQAEKIAFFS
ncbi:MAG TPA: hypothetical protein VGC86_07710 [Afipia sp.]